MVGGIIINGKDRIHFQPHLSAQGYCRLYTFAIHLIQNTIYFRKRGVKYQMNIVSNDLGLILKIILKNAALKSIFQEHVIQSGDHLKKH